MFSPSGSPPRRVGNQSLASLLRVSPFGIVEVLLFAIDRELGPLFPASLGGLGATIFGIVRIV